MKSRRIAIGAAALAVAISVPAADSQRLETVVPMCDSSGSLVIAFTSDMVAKSIAGLVEAAQRDDAKREQLVQLLQGELCARRGPTRAPGCWPGP
ncbi:hypothetical protein [Roseateles sp. MS654]|uniref:hypothetical protein n=1 Tax=Roseateles sp. MS654 TaxID=3412685 RepID=UPI003C2B874E